MKRWLLVFLCAVGVVAVQGRSHLVGAEHLHFHAAILGVGSAVAAFFRRLFFAQTDHVDAVDRNVVLRYQVIHHGIGAFPAQFFVILPRTGGVGVALDGDEKPLVGLHVGDEFIEVALGFIGQRVPVELEGDGGCGLQFVVVEIGHDGSQTGYTLHSLIRSLSGCRSLLVRGGGAIHRVAGMLIGGCSAFLGRADAALGTFINLFHLVAGVLNLA